MDSPIPVRSTKWKKAYYSHKVSDMALEISDLEKRFFEAVRNALRSAHGYTLSFVKRSIESINAGEPARIVLLEYVIPTSNVKLQFSLSTTSGALLIVHVYGPNGQFFSLNEYLSKYKRNEVLESLFDHRCDLSAVMNTIIALFNVEMNEIITGKRWEEIPRDWMGYK